MGVKCQQKKTKDSHLSFELVYERVNGTNLSDKLDSVPQLYLFVPTFKIKFCDNMQFSSI